MLLIFLFLQKYYSLCDFNKVRLLSLTHYILVPNELCSFYTLVPNELFAHSTLGSFIGSLIYSKIKLESFLLT